MMMTTMREALRLALTTDLSHRCAARVAGIAPNTVRKYRKRAADKGITWAMVDAMDDGELEHKFRTSMARLSEKPAPDWAEVHQRMQAKHQTLLQCWEEYRLESGNDAMSYSQFCHRYRRFVRTIDLTMRQMHYAGECTFVDFAGRTIPWTDVSSGREHHAQVFVSAIGCSNFTFAWACRSQKIEDWIDAHNRMFRYYGGVTRSVVPDNLRAAVTFPGQDFEVNRTYLELARYFGTIILPTRVRRPQDKAKAEAAVLMVSRWIIVVLRRRKFFSVEEINEAIADLLEKLNNRPFKRLPGCRRSRFEALDRPALQPLPVQPFEYAEWIAEQKVGPDYHVWVRDHAYSVPFSLVGERVEARVSARTVELVHRNRRVAAHARSFETGLHTTDPNHRPPQHAAYARQTPERFRRWARGLGASALTVVEAQFADKPEYSMAARKACMQLMQLARTFGDERFGAACERALAIKSPTVKSVRSILHRRLDETVVEVPLQGQLPLHDNVRGPDYYREGI